MQKVRGVGGLFFQCEDPEKLAAWYKNHLGIHMDGPTYGMLNPNEAKPMDRTVFSTFSKDSDYFSPSKQTFMFNFIVDDVAAMLEQVVKGGARQIGEIQQESYGDFGWFTDPEGHKVELWSPKGDELN
ncbi:VOC family protein [Marinicella sediminis]|uniref:VOC family protein n=1 Tax=Marinicella sediminis TaxID=1792834 RepID=A0ABV7J8G8_9GAMM|nr:VOC family protein [Marinicella sediminis]